jgi:processive 1,2-diacylglycerol beta-glucosyltransferase
MAKILVLINAVDGINYHRLIAPYNLIKENSPDDIVFFSNMKNEEKGYQTIDSFTVEDFRDYSHVVFNRVVSTDFADAKTIACIKKAGCKLVMDIDDNWVLNKSHFMYAKYHGAKMNEQIEYCLKQADVIQVASKQLQRIIKKDLKKDSTIIYNAINPHSEQFETKNNIHNHSHVAFIGGIGHRGDLMSILPAIAKVQADDYFTFTISGYAPGHEEWERLRRYIYSLGIECYFEFGQGVFDYARMYLDKGIVIAPLTRNKFNDCKSALKVIEAGWFSKAVICSDTIAFKDIDNVVKFKDVNEFEADLRLLLNDVSLQESLGTRLNKEVSKKFDITRENQKREVILGI